jgi:hypothetical protein
MDDSADIADEDDGLEHQAPTPCGFGPDGFHDIHVSTQNAYF